MRPLDLELQQRLELIVRGTPWLLEVLEVVRALRLPNWYLAAGAIRNTVWDALHGSTSVQPHSDLDVIYFDPAKLPNDAESSLRSALPQYTWEVTNQASVHHWQSSATGREIPAYGSIAAAMASWPETATAVGVRLSDHGTMDFIAPYGLVDLFALTLRPSPAASDPSAYAARLRQKAWHLRWPRLIIELALCAIPALLGCSASRTTSVPAAQPPTPQVAPRSPAARNPPAAAQDSSTAWAETNEFTLPVPVGYRDATTEFPGAGFDIVLARNDGSDGMRATLVIRRVPIPGGSFDEPAECSATGRGLIQGGTESPGTGGTLRTAQIIDGPVGKTCQIHLVAPEGVALITELHRPGNSRSTPKDIWLMTCNHPDGDAAAESACRFALAGFRFRDR